MSFYILQAGSIFAVGKSGGDLSEDYYNAQNLVITNRSVYNSKAEQIDTGLEQGMSRDSLLSFKIIYTVTKSPKGGYNAVAVFKPNFDPDSNVSMTFRIDSALFGLTINEKITINNNPGQQTKYKCTSAFQYYTPELQYSINYGYLGIGYTILFLWKLNILKNTPPDVTDEFRIAEIKQLPLSGP